MYRKKAFIIASVVLAAAFLAAFVYLTPFAGNLAAHTRFEGYARSVGIRIIKKSPPLPSVASGQTQIPVIQSSYCWDICADNVGGEVTFKGATPTVVTLEADIKVSFSYKPAPKELNVQQFDDCKMVPIPLKNGYY